MNSLLSILLAIVAFCQLTDNLLSEATTNSTFSMNECVHVHNRFRARHGSPPVTADPAVISFAQSRADEIAASDVFAHKPGIPYGENLYLGYNTSCAAPVEAWYSEYKYYDYTNPGFTSKTGHFTQVIWKSSIRLGCGLAKSQRKSGVIYVVCNYSPAGNFLGEFPQNVGRPNA